MIYKEEKGNLFEVPDKYYLAHCVSTDCALGAGIAVQFQKQFRLRDHLKASKPIVGQAILIDRVFNLFTKKVYYGKPTYDTLTAALEDMKNQCTSQNIKFLAKPKIAAGLDRLSWPRVREILQKVFENTDVEILVRYR